VEFSSSTRKGEKFSAPQEVLVFQKRTKKIKLADDDIRGRTPSKGKWLAQKPGPITC
jgi:hypothetical protein